MLIAESPGNHPFSTVSPDFLWDFNPEIHHWALEASTSYSMYPAARDIPEKMRDYGIDPKLYYILRNPLDRIVPDYNFCRGKSWADQSLPITDAHYYNRSKYFTQLEQYRKVWPGKKITLLDFSELKRGSNGLLKQICGELDIPFKPLEFRKKFVHKTVIPTRAQDIAYRHPMLRGAVNLFPASVRRTMNRMPVLNKREKAVLSPGQKDELRDLLAEDMRRLKQSYGFPVENWGF